MTLLQGIKLYPKAVFWSMLISTCIAMEGYEIHCFQYHHADVQFRYDVSLLSNFCKSSPWTDVPR